MEDNVSNNSVPKIIFKGNEIIHTNEYASKIFRSEEFGWQTDEELNWYSIAFGGKVIKRILSGKRAGIETDSISRLGIETKDGRWLTLYDLKVYMNSDISTISFKEAKIKNLKEKGDEADICFKAPKYFDCKVKPWLGYVVKYCLNNHHIGSSKLEHKIEIDMAGVEKISEEIIKLVTDTLKHPSLIISNPNKEVYEKLIVNKFPKENIINYKENSLDLANL